MAAAPFFLQAHILCQIVMQMGSRCPIRLTGLEPALSDRTKTASIDGQDSLPVDIVKLEELTYAVIVSYLPCVKKRQIH